MSGPLREALSRGASNETYRFTEEMSSLKEQFFNSMKTRLKKQFTPQVLLFRNLRILFEFHDSMTNRAFTGAVLHSSALFESRLKTNEWVISQRDLDKASFLDLAWRLAGIAWNGNHAYIGVVDTRFEVIASRLGMTYHVVDDDFKYKNALTILDGDKLSDFPKTPLWWKDPERDRAVTTANAEKLQIKLKTELTKHPDTIIVTYIRELADVFVIGPQGQVEFNIRKRNDILSNHPRDISLVLESNRNFLEFATAQNILVYDELMVAALNMVEQDQHFLVAPSGTGKTQLTIDSQRDAIAAPGLRDYTYGLNDAGHVSRQSSDPEMAFLKCVYSHLICYCKVSKLKIKIWDEADLYHLFSNLAEEFDFKDHERVVTPTYEVGSFLFSARLASKQKDIDSLIIDWRFESLVFGPWKLMKDFYRTGREANLTFQEDGVLWKGEKFKWTDAPNNPVRERAVYTLHDVITYFRFLPDGSRRYGDEMTIKYGVNGGGLTSLIWIAVGRLQDEFYRFQTLFSGQTHFAKWSNYTARSTWGHSRTVARLNRLYAAQDAGWTKSDSFEITATKRVGRKLRFASVSGHLIWMMTAANFQLVDWEHWLVTVESNVRISLGDVKLTKSWRKAYEETLIMEDNPASFTRLWHTRDEWLLSVAAYQIQAEDLGLKPLDRVATYIKTRINLIGDRYPKFVSMTSENVRVSLKRGNPTQ
jgi:hypothetical protein